MPVGPDPESADDLVEDEQRAGVATRVGEMAQPLVALRQQTVVGGQRLDDRGGQRRARFREHLVELLVVIERRDQRLAQRRVGDAGARRGRAAGQSAAGLHEHAVGVAVVAALELEDARSAGRGAGDAERGHHRLGARRDEADALDMRDVRDDPFGQRERVRLAGAERPAVVDRGVRGASHVVVVVAEDQRTEALAEIDVLAAAGVDEGRPVAAREEERRAADTPERAHRTVNAAWRDPERTFVQARGIAHPANPRRRAWRAPYEMM